jgi:hypothetical protein
MRVPGRDPHHAVWDAVGRGERFATHEIWCSKSARRAKKILRKIVTKKFRRGRSQALNP